MDDFEKSTILRCTNEFFFHYNNLSLSDSRSILYKHPVFKVAKDLILNNKLYFNEFWDKILSTRRKDIESLETFRAKILKDIDVLIS